MFRLFQSELLKIRKSSIWLLIFISPLLSFLIGWGYKIMLSGSKEQWFELMAMMTSGHAVLFLPLLSGVFASFVCRYEHVGGGWKQLLAMPVSRTQVYIVKGIVVSLLMLCTQLLFAVGVLVNGWLKDLDFAQLPVDVLLQSIIGGWISTLPLVSLILFVSIGWASFAAPLALNVIFTIPNMLVLNSETFRPYYPWAQPTVMMMPSTDASAFGTFALNDSMGTFILVLFSSFVLFSSVGLIYFKKKEI